ncbi:MAG: ATP-binding protein, partial [Candidatus Poribacteria bacterium]
PQGYFFVARLLDKKYVTELSELTKGETEIIVGNSDLSQKEGVINFTKILKTWNNNPIGYVNIEFKSRFLPVANRIFRNELIFFGIFSAVFVIFILTVLSRYVVTPLQLMSKSLQTKDITYINKIQKKSDEFGVLARLILDFFKVNEELQQEIIERKRMEEERIKLEERIARQERMESLGRLAGGVAHDLNNILTGLVTYPDYLLWTIPDNAENKKFRDIVNTIKESGERASAVVSDLLTITRSNVVEKKPLNLNKLIEDYKKSPEYIELMNRYPRITFETLLDRDLYNISGSAHMIHKALMNLVINAAEAMPDGGKITVSTENRNIDKNINGYENIQEGDYVVLSISDQGTGISQEDLKRIFEPFYTKKVMGRSETGLGLPIVWNTMQSHSGYINIQSQEGVGTTFELYFPITKEEIEQQIDIPIDQYKGNNEKILVVDDVPEQRVLASLLLSNLGYNVEAV